MNNFIKLNEWKINLKAVLLHNRNKYQSGLLAHATKVNIEENNANLDEFEKIKYS